MFFKVFLDKLKQLLLIMFFDGYKYIFATQDDKAAEYSVSYDDQYGFPEVSEGESL